MAMESIINYVMVLLMLLLATYGSCSEAGTDSSTAELQGYDAFAAAIKEAATDRCPQQSSADKGGHVEFLVFVSSADNVPTFKDPQFSPMVIPIMPRSAEGQQQQQQQQQRRLGPAGDMPQLLAGHRAQFLLSVGDRRDFGFLDTLPAQMRQKRFHIDRPDQLTVEAVETFYWHAIRAPAGGPASEPLLSLFTPAYKSGRKIQIPYNSLLTQTYQNWEWVIYDDSPPEHTETWRELSALRDRDYRIKIYKSDRNDAFIGSVKAKACHMATGQLLIELDHDDTLTPDALDLLRDALLANPDAGFFYTEAIELYEGTTQTVDYGHNWAFGQGAHYKMLYDGFWATGAIAPPLNHKTLRHIVGVPNHVRAWRREAYLAIGGHARGLPVADDYDLILRAVFKFPAVYVRHMTYIQYRQLDASTFTFTRNALIQRLVNIISRHSDPQIHRALEARGLRDPGRNAKEAYFLLWNEYTPSGTPFSRYFHRPTMTAPQNQPYMTVVIPTYNNTAALQKAIESVYAQDYENWELLIVGNNCPQLDAFMEGHKKAVQESGHIVRYYNMHPGSGEGMHAPLNLAAKVLAPSDWIAYLNDSAVWKPDHLKTLAEKIGEDPKRSFVFTSVQHGDEVTLASEPVQDQMDMSAVVHHRRLIEQLGGWRAKDDAPGGDIAWELFSRWANEPWGATLQPTVVYSKAAVQQDKEAVQQDMDAVQAVQQKEGAAVKRIGTVEENKAAVQQDKVAVQ